MKNLEIYTGTIMKCIKYEPIKMEVSDGAFFGYTKKVDKVYKKNACLIKVNDEEFIDLKNFNIFLKMYLSVVNSGKNQNLEKSPKKLIININGNNKGEIFVDKDSLRFCSTLGTNKDISVAQLIQLKKSLKK